MANVTDPRIVERVNELIRDQKEAIGEVGNAYESLNAARQTALDNLNAEGVALQGNIESINNYLAATSDLSDTQKLAYKQIQAGMASEKDALKDQAGEVEKLQGRYKGMANTIRSKFGIKSFKESFLGKADQMAKDGTLGDTITDLGKGMKEAFNPKNLGLTSMDQFLKNSLEFSKMQETLYTEFRRTTGAAKSYDDEISKAANTSMALGAGLAENTKAFQALYQNFTDFTRVSEEQRASIQRLTVTLDGIGVGGDAAAGAMQTLSKSFNQTTDQSKKSLVMISNLAQDIGVPPAQMIQDLNATGSSLAKFGKQADAVFKTLAVSAKALGASVSELMGAMGQYDTFDKAAEAAGRLNSLLGGPFINSVQLLNANEDERIRIMQRSMEASGRQFETMNKFEKQAIANAAGIQDMALANKIFGMTASEYDRVQAEANKYNQSQEDLEESAKANVALQTRMNQLTEAFAVALTPVREFLADVIEQFLEWNDSMGGALAPILAVTAGLFAMGPIMKIVSIAAGVLAPLLPFVGAGAAGAAPGIAAMGAALGAAVPFILAFAAAAAGIGVMFAGIGYAFGGGESDEAERIIAAGKAVEKVEQGVEILTAMIDPLSEIEQSIDNIISKMEEMPTTLLAVSGLAMAAAAPVLMAAGTAGGGSPQIDTEAFANTVGDKVASSIERVFSSFKLKLNDRVLANFVRETVQR